MTVMEMETSFQFHRWRTRTEPNPNRAFTELELNTNRKFWLPISNMSLPITKLNKYYLVSCLGDERRRRRRPRGCEQWRFCAGAAAAVAPYRFQLSAKIKFWGIIISRRLIIVYYYNQSINQSIYSLKYRLKQHFKRQFHSQQDNKGNIR